MNYDLTEPFLLKPLFKEKIWGGTALEEKLGKDLPDFKVGESWEISGLDNEQTSVLKGSLAGTPLGELYSSEPQKLVGDRAYTPDFPLLFKFIDAEDRLSVQVHPTDEQAVRNNWGSSGKSECWYIVDAHEDARIIVGFKPGVSQKQIRDAILSNSLPEILNYIPIVSGDVLFIPAGTVHAIMEGTLIYEVQEASDITLRLYDWDRTDEQGRSRKLHTEEALSVLDTSTDGNYKIEPVIIDEPNGIKHSYRAACRYFALEQYAFFRDTQTHLQPKSSFRAVSVIGEAVQLVHRTGSLQVPRGQSALIPANLEDVWVSGTPGSRFLLTSIPDLKKEIIEPLQSIGLPREAIALLGGFESKNDLLKAMQQ
ncbi:MAG: type I phosphomannose isomerase catalytic subunit [Chitinispirillaceae bacterium]